MDGLSIEDVVAEAVASGITIKNSQGASVVPWDSALDARVMFLFAARIIRAERARVANSGGVDELALHVARDAFRDFANASDPQRMPGGLVQAIAKVQCRIIDLLRARSK